MLPVNQLILVLAEYWGYWIVLGATFLETLPIVGGIFPGQTVLIASGFLARIDVLNPLVVISLAAVAAIVGDCVAYGLGRRYGLSVMERLGKFVAVSPEALLSTRKKLEEHAGKTLILGRFLPVTRALAPFVAGASNVKMTRFFIYNVIGGISWAAVSVGFGYLAGASYQLAAAYFGRALMVLVLTIGVGWGLLHWYRRQRATLSSSVLGAITLNVAGLIAFALLAYGVSQAPLENRFDWQFSQWVISLRTEWWTAIWLKITTLFNPLPVIAWSVGLLFLTWRVDQKIGRWLPLAAMAGGIGIGLFIKAATDRPRPDFALLTVPGSSFPSLHAMAAALLVLVLAWIFAPRLHSVAWRHWLPIGASVVCLLIGWSRVYLGVHWLSDVLAGYALALWWFSFVILLTKIFGSARVGANLKK